VNQRNLTPDGMFDYRTCNPACGCLMPVLERMGHPGFSLGTFLGIPPVESDYLYGGAHPHIDPRGKNYPDMLEEEAKGAAGKREALRRLSVLSKRHSVWNKGRLDISSHLS
jgi:hypothetical protein